MRWKIIFGPDGYFARSRFRRKRTACLHYYQLRFFEEKLPDEAPKLEP